MSGGKLRWLGLGLVTTAGAGVLALTAIMNSAFAYGDVVPDAGGFHGGGGFASVPDTTEVMGGSGLPIPPQVTQMPSTLCTSSPICRAP
jgi:hypothetical protein